MSVESELSKLRKDLQEREKRDKLHDIWKIQFESFCGESNPDPQQIRLFWNYVGWCGLNGYIDAQQFEETGFKNQALQQVKLCSKESSGTGQTVQEILCDLIPFLEEHWPDELENILTDGKS